MTTFETSQGFVDAEGYRVNVTARLDAPNREHMKALVEKTMRLWLYVARHIAEGKRICSPIDCPEDMVVRNHFLPLSEARVTIWGDMPNRAGFTVHSHSKAQDVLDVYWARLDGLASFIKEPPKAPTSPQSTETPKTPQNAANVPPDSKEGQSSEAVKVGGKKDATALPNGTVFELSICQIKKRSQDGTEYFEFFGKYGNKIGDWPEMNVYTDNEVAQKNGLLDKLNTLGLTPGKDKLGEWTLKGKVAEKDGKKKLYALALKEAA